MKSGHGIGRIALGYVGVLVTLAVLAAVFKSFLIFLAGAAIGGVVVIVLIAKAQGKKPSAVAREAVQAVVPTDDTVSAVTSRLLQVNADLRTNYGIGEAVRTESESIVDELAPVCADLISKLPGDEFTFNTCRIATYHLPRTLAPYLSASPEARVEMEPKILDALKVLKKAVLDIKQLLHDESITDARHRAAAVIARFNDFT